MFDSDDNDDGLSLDGEPTGAPVKPQSPSSPSRPSPRNPFGVNANQVQKPVPPVPSVQRTTPPFGRSIPSGKPTLPNSAPVPAQPSPVESKPPSPFVRPEIHQPQPKVTPPATPDISTYLPPRYDPTETQTQVTEPDPYGQPERLSEDELYMREIKERSAERAEAARQAEEERESKTTFRNTVHVADPVETQLKKVEPEPETVVESKGKKKKGGFFAPPPKTPKGKKGGSKEPPEKKYQGERKKVLYIRIIAGTLGTIIAVAGMQAIFLPDSGPSRTQVMSAAQEAVNFTGFPTISGEQFALDFTKAYFNYDSNNESRVTSLERFASPDLVKEIEIQILTAEEYESVAKVGQSYSDYKVTQRISYGPYVVNSKNLTAENAVFTVKVGIESGSVLYVDVPVKYSPKNYSMTLAGPPSFSKPIQNKGGAAKEEWTTTFENGSDDEIATTLQGDLKAYLSAWAMSDSTIINRYILDSATDNAKKGLQKSVKFHSIITFEVEPFTETKPQTANARRVEVNVLWEDPKTGIRYPQQYRMLIGLNQEGKWAIHDIENFAILN